MRPDATAAAVMPSPPRARPPDDSPRPSEDYEEDDTTSDAEATDDDSCSSDHSETGPAGTGAKHRSDVTTPSYAGLNEALKELTEAEETIPLPSAGRSGTSVYLQELRGQRRRRARSETDLQLVADEALARRLQAELVVAEDSQAGSETDVDAELASRVATLLMDKELPVEPAGRPADSASPSRDPTDIASTVEQMRILDLILREREQRLANEAMRRSEPSESRSLHLPATQSRSIQPQARYYSSPNSPSSMHSNHSTSSELQSSSETPEQIQRRKEAYERQFYDRTTGSLVVTPAEREILRKTGSIDPSSHHVHGRLQYNAPQMLRPSYPRQVQPPSARRVLTSPDWEQSQRQAFMEHEQNDRFRAPTPNASELGFDRLSGHAWRQLRAVPQPPRHNTRGYDREPNDNYLWHREQLLTQGTLRTASSHIVLCQGCGNRLNVPVHSSLVACPACGMVSPGKAIQEQPLYNFDYEPRGEWESDRY